MLSLVVLVSGGGTNLQAIIDGIDRGSIRNCRIAGVISNRKNAYALERASKHSIPAVCIPSKEYQDREAFHQRLLEQVDSFQPDLLVLAGFLVKISPDMVKRYHGRIINIHPSLIPSFCGVGYYGLMVHEKALERGVKVTGATVHFVDEDMDTGPILLQKAVEVQPDDTPESLQRRVMEQVEQIILPQAIDMLAGGEGWIGGTRL